MNEEQSLIEQSNVVLGEVKIKKDFNILYFLGALVIDLLLTIIYCVFPLFKGEELSNMVVFGLLMAASQISVGLGLITFISFIFLYFFRYQYKMVFLSLISSVTTFAIFLILSNLDGFNIIWLGVLSASIITVIYFVLESKKKTITKKIAYQFYLSLLVSIITILLLATSAGTNMQSNAKYRNEIDLQRIVPANIMSDYDNVIYEVKYSGDKNSNNYHRVDISLPMSQYGTKADYISGIVDIALSKQNYGQKDSQIIHINNQEATLSCQDSRTCNIYWQRGKYHINFYASLNGDKSYASTTTKQEVKDELISIMLATAKKIEQNSQYLSSIK